MIRALAALMALAFASSVGAADSVVIGRGISNKFLSNAKCSDSAPCLDAQYLWIFRSSRTVVGPPVRGRIRAIATQHTGATSKFVRSVELFVLRPIDEASPQRSSSASFLIVSSSPRDTAGRYCLSVDPSTVGLHLAAAKLSTVDGRYCFSADLL